MYRKKGISFCDLGEIVVVLDSQKGEYFKLSRRAASLLRSIPECDDDPVEPCTGGVPDIGVLTSLQNAGLIICSSESDSDMASMIGPEFTGPDVAYWGSVSELTQGMPSGPVGPEPI